jgi:hypothetical protein
MVAVRARPVARRSYQGPACPSCAAALRAGDLVTGPGHCPSCGMRYEAAAFTPVADPGPTVLPVGAAGEGTPCAKHARNVSEASCVRCGTFMCQLCRIDTDAMVLCPGCFDRLAGEGALPSARRTFRDHSRMALTLAVIGFPFMIFGLLIGPCAVWAAWRGLRARRQLGVSISRTRCIVALIAGVLETVGGGAFLATLLGAFK